MERVHVVYTYYMQLYVMWNSYTVDSYSKVTCILYIQICVLYVWIEI